MKDAQSSLNSLKDCLQVLTVAKTMLPQISEQFDDQNGDPEEEAAGLMMND